jgi:hypothetical protein
MRGESVWRRHKVLSRKLERVLACVVLTSDLLNGHTNLGRQ